MSLDDIEIASRYGALDSEAASDGGFVHAHVLRALSRSMNQLLGEGHSLLTLLFDARAEVDSDVEERAIIVPAPLYWSKIIPGAFMRKKKPGLNRADFCFRARIQTDEAVLVQVQGLFSGLDRSGRGLAGRTAVFTGTGAAASYWIRDVPISEGAIERLAFWIRGIPGTTLGDTAACTAGGRNIGQIDRVATHRADLGPTALIEAHGSAPLAWNRAGNTWASGGHYFHVHDGPNEDTVGNTILQANIPWVSSDSSLGIFPGPDLVASEGLRGKFFQIRRLPTFRCRAISSWTNDRTVW